jgi:hypothetical protein
MTNQQGTDAVVLDKLLGIAEFEAEIIKHNIKSDEQLVALILENERDMFEVIFKDFNFDGNEDAIDILFTVSKVMSANFRNLTPSVTHVYKYKYPVVYQKHLDKRIQFINEKIQVNMRKGISQGMYRDDLSIELVARRYISRLLDIHDPDSFPPEQFSFNTLFDQMFENFVMSIATQKGIDYYNEKKRSNPF